MSLACKNCDFQALRRRWRDYVRRDHHSNKSFRMMVLSLLGQVRRNARMFSNCWLSSSLRVEPGVTVHYIASTQTPQPSIVYLPNHTFDTALSPPTCMNVSS